MKNNSAYISCIVMIFIINTIAFPTAAQIYRESNEISPDPFEGIWAGWMNEDVSGERVWKKTKYWIVEVRRVNDTLYNGDFKEYYFDDSEPPFPKKLLNLIEKKDVIIFFEEIEGEKAQNKDNYFIYFETVHKPYRNTEDPINGFFVGTSARSDTHNFLNFSFYNALKEKSNDVFVDVFDATRPGIEFPLNQSQLPLNILDLKLDMPIPGPKPQSFENNTYSDLIFLENEVVIKGKHPIGTKVTLFNHLTGEILITSVLQTTSEPSDYWGEIFFSRLAEVPSWANEKLQYYTTVVFGAIDPEILFLDNVQSRDYYASNLIHLGLEKSGILDKSEILKIVSREKVPDDWTLGETMWSILHPETPYDSSFGETMWRNLRTKTPSHYTISRFDKKLFFITYQVTEHGGPVYLQVGDYLYQLPGECSEIPKFYMSKGVLYFRHVSGDCGNGIVQVGNYAVFSNQLVEVYKSFGYSK